MRRLLARQIAQRGGGHMKGRFALAALLAALMLSTLGSAIAFADDDNGDDDNRRPLPCYSDA
jgi:hypothetical protein